MIALALACGPEVLIADEPTTALDVTIQAQILDLLRDLQRDTGMAILFITHDLGVVAEFAHDVAVMYAGEIVETAPVEELFASPQHPYTRGLFASLPNVNEKGQALRTIPGSVPAATNFPPGCRFNPRCPHGMDRCRADNPSLDEVAPKHRAACWLHDNATMAETGRPPGIPEAGA